MDNHSDSTHACSAFDPHCPASPLALTKSTRSCDNCIEW